MSLISLLATVCAGIAAAALLVLCLLLFIECALALTAKRCKPVAATGRRSVAAVLVPAHNESAVITATIEAIRAQLLETDRLVVVADNCTDDTANVAGSAGAEVIERSNPDRRGKGYALAAGRNYIALNPPNVLLIIDADTPPEPGAIERLVRMVDQSGQPAQGLYLFDPPTNGDTRDRLSAFAIILKNRVRAMGLAGLGASIPLTGSGMALPWIASCGYLGGGSIVEDLQTGIDLAIDGFRVQPCFDAKFKGFLPHRRDAAQIQRSRWEHGHISTQMSQIPRLLRVAFRKKSWRLVLMACDLAIPPLALLVVLLAMTSALNIVLMTLGQPSWGAAMNLCSAVLLLVAILMSWGRFARSTVPFSSLAAVPWYVVSKLPIHVGFLVRRHTVWLRTPREPASAHPHH